MANTIRNHEPERLEAYPGLRGADLANILPDLARCRPSRYLVRVRCRPSTNMDTRLQATILLENPTALEHWGWMFFLKQCTTTRNKRNPERRMGPNTLRCATTTTTSITLTAHPLGAHPLGAPSAS